MRWVIAGAGGLLGSAMVAALDGRKAVPLGRSALDPADPAGVMKAVLRERPDVLVNCAALTDVEAAERDPEPDAAVNAVLPGLLAEACARTGAVMIQVSSTGCYGAWKTEPYTEDDPLRPTTAHHRAKAAGEAAVLESGVRALVLRTGWLFGGPADNPKNFVWKRIVEARRGGTLQSDAVQRGCPTFAGDVARQALLLVEDGRTGVFNVVSGGIASRHDYVQAIVAAAGAPCTVAPGPAFARLAPVSPNETAINRRLDEAGLTIMPGWRDALADYVAALLADETARGANA